jgi:hypothetical protein
VHKNNSSEALLLTFGKPMGIIEIQAHPSDIIDIDPVILARMKAKIAGKNFDEMYFDSDNMSSEFLLRKKIDKLKRVFGSGHEVCDRYVSILSIRELHCKLKADQLNEYFLANYAQKCWPMNVLDECDLHIDLLLIPFPPAGENKRMINYLRNAYANIEATKIFIDALNFCLKNFQNSMLSKKTKEVKKVRSIKAKP